MRRDAAHNRERVLAAAEQLFAQHGLDASVDDLADAAGVGMGTLYRNFPTKQCLIDEIVGPRRRELLALTAAAGEKPPGTGFEWLMVEVGRLLAGQPGCIAQLWDHSDAEREALNLFYRRLAELMAEAQTAGRVREELTLPDVRMMFWSVREIVRVTRQTAPDAWQRHLELLLAGLRPPADATPLQHAPLSAAQAELILQTTG